MLKQTGWGCKVRLGRLIAAWVLAAVLSLALLTALHSQLGRLDGRDRAIQQTVHAWTTPALSSLFLTLTWIGKIEVFVPAALVAVAWLALGHRRRQALLLAVAIPGALLLNEGLKQHFHRPRPTVSWSVGDEATYSFPSGHTLFSTVLYGVAAYLLWQAGRPSGLVLAVAMPLGIGLSRVYLGMHYPSDVLAGYLVGLVWLAGVIWADQPIGDHSPDVLT